jgi:putative DNA primase/helicase
MLWGELSLSARGLRLVEMKLKEEALKYQEAGFGVIPVGPNKRPLVRWAEFQVRKASSDEVRAWWNEWPTASIGVITGPINDLTVIDCDSEEAIKTVEELLPEGIEAPVATTPRNGRHYFFRYTQELHSRNGVDANLDVKSEGGYVIVPPSSGANGSYAWNDDLDIKTIPGGPPIPSDLLRYLKDRMNGSNCSVSSVAPSPLDENPSGTQAIAPEFQRLVDGYGAPYYLSRNGDVTTVNQAFWAGLHQTEHVQLYEPDERAFYRYNPENGLYSIVSEDIVKQEISCRLLEVSRLKGLPSLERKRTNSTLNHIVAQLKGISEKKNAFRRCDRFVHLANGVVVLGENGEADLCSFSPDFYSRNQCPIAFNATATCERFLNELLYPAVAADDAVLLKKYAGLCLLGNNLIQKMLILDGKPGRGKSTLALVIQRLVGQANVTELRTRHLSERFELFRYLKKNLLVGVDVPGGFLSEKGAYVIKGLVGGDCFDAEQKCGTGSFPLQGTFCILITSNSRLQVRLEGDTDAWRRRLLIIRFEAAAPARKIPEFHDVLVREEGSGILNWALQGLGMLLKDIEEHGDIQLTETQEISVDKLLAESDSLRHFLVEKVERDENADLSNEELVEAYAEYCPTKGWNPKPITVIHREIESLMLELFGTSKSHSLRRDDKSTRGYRGVAFKR